MPKKISDDMELLIKKLYDEGKGVKETSEITGVSRSCIRRVLNTYRDAKTERIKKYNIRLEQAEALYLEGLSCMEISRRMKMSSKNICAYLKGKGYPILADGRKHTFNYRYFEKIDTKEKAYWLGFLYADGWVGINKNTQKPSYIEISLKDTDYMQLEKFKKEINYTGKITFQNRNYQHGVSRACKLSLSSVDMATDLYNLGCIPNKSLVLTFPSREQLPDEFLFDFVRGYVDGDGSVRIANSSKHSRRYACLSICGTKEFLSELQERTGWNKTKIRKDKRGNVYSFEYHNLYCINYLKQLYDEATVYLDRKYEAYKEIIAVLGSNI